MESIYSSVNLIIFSVMPLVDVPNILKADGAVARVVAKLENLQSVGFVKDRMRLRMILDAEEKVLITPDKTVLIEPMGGNTGIALAMVGQKRDYKVILVMPNNASLERRLLLRALGAEVVLTDVMKGFQGVLEVSKDLVAKTPNSHVVLVQERSKPRHPFQNNWS